jgi:hypothetical protein
LTASLAERRTKGVARTSTGGEETPRVLHLGGISSNSSSALGLAMTYLFRWSSTWLKRVAEEVRLVGFQDPPNPDVIFRVQNPESFLLDGEARIDEIECSTTRFCLILIRVDGALSAFSHLKNDTTSYLEKDVPALLLQGKDLEASTEPISPAIQILPEAL